MIKLTHYLRMILLAVRVATSLEAVFRAAHLRCYPATMKIRTPEQVRLYGELQIPSEVTTASCAKTYSDRECSAFGLRFTAYNQRYI
jgi:hypothetical protein